MQVPGAAHQRVDLDRWIKRFPLEERWREIDAENGPEFWYSPPHDIFSPRDLAYTEQLRARAGFPQHGSAAVPVDVLLPAWGEPPDPFLSKVGGVPYLGREEWPLTGDGTPFIFLAQFCFADSRDVLAGLPFDLPEVLLIFQEDSEEGIESPAAGAKLHFEWRDIDISPEELMRLEDMPPRDSLWAPTHFQRYRSLESEGHGYVDHPRVRIEIPGHYMGSKIGGVPVYLQEAEEAARLGRFFASLHSINPGEREFPFPNLPEAPWRNPWDAGLLMFGDVGTLYLFAAEDGSINWLMQCS